MIPLAFALFFLGENEKLLSMPAEIADCISESQLPQTDKDALRGEMELLLSFLEYNRIDAMSARHRRALELLAGPARAHKRQKHLDLRLALRPLYVLA